MTTLTFTKLSQLNSIVIKQSDGRLFISAPNSIIIDKAGFMNLILELGKVDFIDTRDLRLIREDLASYYMSEIRKELEDEDKENSSDSGVG